MPPSTRILILVENLPVPMDRRVWQEACALRDAGYDVTVICPRMRGFNTPEETLEGIHIHRHWISEEARGLLGFVREYVSALWGQWWLAWKVWRNGRFQLVHLCNPPDLLFLVAWPFKLLFGVRIIYDVHDLWPEMFEAKFGRRGFLYWCIRAAERLTYACADVVMATNQSVRQVAIERGRKTPGQVFIVRTGPNIPTQNYQPDHSLRRNRKFLVGYVGVMGNADGVHYLLEAARYLVHHLGRTDVQFLLMGSGPEYETLVAQRDEWRLEQYVDMPGRVSDQFLFSALRTMDLGVSCDPINPYNHHCTMNKVLEYMTFAKPQVLFDLKEGRASAGDAAAYVPVTSAEKLAEAIVRLLDDPIRREQMGQLGAARANGPLSWSRSVEQLLAAYATVLDRQGLPQKTAPIPTTEARP